MAQFSIVLRLGNLRGPAAAAVISAPSSCVYPRRRLTVSAHLLEKKSHVLESKFGKDVLVPPHNLVEYVWKDLSVWKDKKFVSCGVTGVSYTYEEGRSLGHGFARALVGKVGLVKGDVVAIVAPNIPEYVFAAYGVLEAGLVATFVNPLYTAEETGRQLKISGAKLVVTIPSLLPLIQAVGATLPGYKGTIVMNDKTNARAAHTAEWDFHSLAAEGLSTEGVLLPRPGPEDLAILPFSSGTSGMPKGVMLTHGNCTSNLIMVMHPAFRMAVYTTDTAQDSLLTVLPLFHIYGFNSVLNTTICSGQHMILLPKFTPESYIGCLVKSRPTGLCLVPAILQFLAVHPAVTREHLSSVRYIMCGAAPLGRELVEKINEKAGRILDVRQGYGLTETSPVTLFCNKYTPIEQAGAVGQLVPGTRARVIDLTTGEDLGVDQRGELLVKGPQVMKGYLNNQEATREVLDSEGWLHTGDVAFYDKDQYFYVVDRTKELIKVKGNQVSPTELEGVILQIDGIVDVAVVGIPDERCGEIPKAFVVSRPGVKVTEKDIQSYVEPKVAPYKKLVGGVSFLDAIPRNAGGKILRNRLKEMATSQ